jgi:hypothetical protein
LSRRTETQYEIAHPAPKEGLAKRATLAGPNLLEYGAPCGELKSSTGATGGCRIDEAVMRILNFICRTTVRLAKWAWTFPQSIVTGFRVWRQQAALNAAETERLDRIRHPSKYLGK